MHPYCRTWTSRQAYYNSSQHFLRSVYENRLEENGYILAMADNSTIIRLDIIKYDPIGIEKNACFATNLLYYCGRVGVKGSLFNIPQMLEDLAKI